MFIFVTVTKRAHKLLKEVSVNRKKDLTPKASHLYKSALGLKRRALVLSRKCLTFKQRLAAAEKYSDSNAFQQLLPHLNKTTQTFFLSQVRSQRYKPKGRRYTTDDKIFALALMKQSGKVYRLLSRF